MPSAGWHAAAILATAGWIVLVAHLWIDALGRGTLLLIFLVSWPLLPIALYIDSKQLAEQTGWPESRWLYIFPSMFWGIAIIPGVVYLLNRRSVDGSGATDVTEPEEPTEPEPEEPEEPEPKRESLLYELLDEFGEREGRQIYDSHRDRHVDVLAYVVETEPVPDDAEVLTGELSPERSVDKIEFTLRVLEDVGLIERTDGDVTTSDALSQELADRLG
ncbi:hypothetical protein [Natrialbaceae archaeon AArc-T1-2]|uniref:hypothetical protein n=1 Tax=Natrialbaceae archaeon AArc-T1-2 TaxID=3053904 RepID=UPI00255A8846|nr:hypothetical protein [Natrialbaceae archaeon AArc-T1-2]WIV66067.1 hypothetical protein QQ977_10215 [Natrialbaceae archaeon AArc-T1-2]